MTFALLPAGGKSTRMGRPKLSLPLAGRSVLEWVIDALQRAEVASILVVVGPHVPELAKQAESGGAQVLLLPAETADMRATVTAGLDWVEANWQPRPEDQWLLVPADHPTLEPAVVRQLQQARQTHAGGSIVIPTYQGQRGHPTLIDWKHVAGIRALPPGKGLNFYFRQHQEETLQLPLATESILWDLDTPEDYERLQYHWKQISHTD
jgi:molybdenum cofactor cytidylyltransferase